ncbi:hypothetical protein GCM10027050_22370 [Psychrosphaera aestuarii]
MDTMYKYNLQGLVVIVLLLFCNKSTSKQLFAVDVDSTDTCISSPKESQTDNHKNPLNPCPTATEKLTKSAVKGEQQALDDVSRKFQENQKEERLKVLFVDVNSMMETVGSSMDWTANWIDSKFAETEQGKNKAKAWGHINIGWEPRQGEWSNLPVKFRVRAKLPNLENKVELILSDNEQEDLNSLPYETVRPEALKSSQRSLGAAVRFMHASTEHLSSSSRIGTGDGQMYVRSSITYNEKFWSDKLIINLQPSVEYYYSDGLAGRLLIDTAYAINLKNELRFSYLLQDRESYEAATWRNGIYSISALTDKTALIIGATAAGVVEPDYRPEFYKFSVRIRKKAIRSWIFLEFEPFVEFNRARLVDDPINGHIYGDFERDIGVALRFEAHYGFH